MTALDDIFRPGGATGALRSRDSYRGRRSDAWLRASPRRLTQREHLLVEAGTGTGKTFAYLVPALLSGLRVLISTGTRTLQDQLYTRDIPLLAGALGRPLTTALLEGPRQLPVSRQVWSGAGAQQTLLAEEEPTLLGEVRDWADEDAQRRPGRSRRAR